MSKLNNPTNRGFETEPVTLHESNVSERVLDATRRVGEIAAGTGLLYLSYLSLKHVGMTYVEINPIDVSVSTPDYLSAGVGVMSGGAGITALIHGLLPRDKS